MPSKARATVTDTPKRSRSILVVDDDLQIIELLSENLTELGYDVMSAQNGENAYLLLEYSSNLNDEMPIKAVITDWLMPGGNGIELLKRIRTSPFKEIPVLLMSGAVTREELQEALHNHADSILLKPFAMEELLKQLDAAIAKRAKKAAQKPPQAA